jgi:hypothetical protein
MERWKRYSVYFLILLALTSIAMFVRLTYYCGCDGDPGTSKVLHAPDSARSTNILVSDGTTTDVLRYLVFSNISTINGTVTLMTDPLKIGSSNGRFSWDGSEVVVSNDAGSTTHSLAAPATLGSPVQFSNYSGHFRWNTTESRLEFSNDNTASWSAIGSGSGQGYALTSADHTNTFLETTKTGQYTQLDSTTLQMSFFANFADLATAENFIHRIEVGYSCTMLRFGKNASDQLVYEQGTTYDDPCVSTSYTTTATLTAAQQARWVEYAVQVDEGNNITFYVDGEIFEAGQAMTSAMLAQAVNNETLRFYEGWEGSGGPIKIGDDLTWPTTGWKGIDTETNAFPMAVLVLPLTEEGQSSVTDTVGSEAFAVDGDVTWETVRGGF